MKKLTSIALVLAFTITSISAGSEYHYAYMSGWGIDEVSRTVLENPTGFISWSYELENSGLGSNSYVRITLDYGYVFSEELNGTGYDSGTRYLHNSGSDIDIYLRAKNSIIGLFSTSFASIEVDW